MSRYFMELPSTDEKTCEYAIKWLKKNYPYITEGFIKAYKYTDWNNYDCSSLVWYDNNNNNFLYWGSEPCRYDIIVPFPSYDAIDIGEL